MALGYSQYNQRKNVASAAEKQNRVSRKTVSEYLGRSRGSWSSGPIEVPELLNEETILRVNGKPLSATQPGDCWLRLNSYGYN